MTFPACSDRAARRIRARGQFPALLAGAAASVLALCALAIEPFVVRDIRVEGVQRTEAGTIFNYLPIKVGDRVTDERMNVDVAKGDLGHEFQAEHDHACDPEKENVQSGD